MERVRKFIVTHLWWVVLVVALAMLISHSFGVRGIVVDNISLILLALVLISPFVAAIKKVKIGEFEAEIEPEEVKRVAQQVEKSLPPPAPTPSLVPEISETAAAIASLAETDLVVALAKLRIELETRLRRIHQRINSHGSVRKRPVALSYVIRELVTREVFGQDFGKSLLDVISICNRAIHGEDIRDIDARQIINTGSDLLEFLERTVHEYAATHPLEKKVITPQERDEFASGRYRLTTVVPYVDNPEERVYVLNQDELDAFLEGYSEVAEFMVRLEKVE
jgi:hypothetical protein